MKTTSFRARTLACALLATTAYCGLTAQPAAAQTQAAPSREAVDANGVDLLTGHLKVSWDFAEARNAAHSLSYQRSWISEDGWFESIEAGIFEGDLSGELVVSIGDFSNVFTLTNGVYEPKKKDGSTLTNNGMGYYIVRDRGGTEYQFKIMPSGMGLPAGLVTHITRPSGEKLSYWYKWAEVPENPYDPESAMILINRLQSIVSTAGFQLRFRHTTDTLDTSSPGTWQERVKAHLVNSAVDYCDPEADSCTFSQTWPTMETNGWSWMKDSAGRTTNYTTDLYTRITGIRPPGASSDRVTISYVGTTGQVASVTNPNGTWAYSFSDSGNTRTATVTNPLNQQRVVTSDIALGVILSDKDGLNRTTSYQYDTNGRLTRVTADEDNYVEYTYDARGNVTETRHVAKPSSGLADIVTTASYDTTCTDFRKCNKPNSVTDARGNTTSFTYDASHGGVLTETQPAVGGVSPQTRYTYSSPYAQQKNSGGSLVPAATPITKLTSVSACRTGSSCTGTSDEVKTTIAYSHSNLLPTGVSTGAGDGSLTATTTSTYDNVGNVLTVDGPLSGSADTTRYRYDNVRQLVGVAGPDPDGTGALKHRAQRVTYNADGQVTKAENGTVNSQSDSDWAAFASLEAVETGYDAGGRPVTAKLTDSTGAAYALTQTSYDAAGRPECTAQRMNISAFSSLPSSACTLGTQGSHGPDRITKTIYDAAGQVTQVKTALGVTGEEADEMTATYRDNGQVETVTDAQNNKTTYVYDGHDRLSQTQYPSATKGAGASNPADYEQLGYDAGSSVTSFRARDGQTIGYVYDALGRMTFKDLPNTAMYEADVGYGYDLLGRLTAAFDSNGYSGTFSYDALGRRLVEESNWYGARVSAYDLAGRRTRLTWRDGFFVTYDHLVTGEMTAIRENGATSGAGVLATFGYDDLGRRTSLARGNGTSTSYTYDAVSRLSQLDQDFPWVGSDLGLSLTYNPAGQIVTRSGAHGAYAWTGAVSGTTSSPANGLNQLTSHGGAALVHDAKGNLVSDGSRTFSYTAESRLATGPSTNLIHDPLGRLYGILSGVILDYDGSDLITEIDQPTGLQVLRRYVHGPGTDEPLVWYEGPGTADKRWLHADERGSIVAVSDSSGNALAYNAYDEYGQPAPTNTGRFQYTGQKWIPELGLYDYKARMYDPKVGGRFLQPDPIGYGDGMNPYLAMGGDPVNNVDPTGLDAIEVCGGSRDRSGNCVSRGISPGAQMLIDRVSRDGPTLRGRLGLAAAERAQPKLPALKAKPHRFEITRMLQCTAGKAFQKLMQEGNSAPGAPRAREGTSRGVRLWGNHPITQVVDSANRTIRNITEVGHRYHPGSVTLRITPITPGTSRITIVGQGTGEHAYENDVVGSIFFGGVATLLSLECMGGLNSYQNRAP
ncbi:MAG TPA: RHS repeat-associated core domain-containing protein [Allosphingosinicella sp.]|jgi:RHS repeat-associated protein